MDNCIRVAVGVGFAIAGNGFLKRPNAVNRCQKGEYQLGDTIDEFIADTRHPSTVRGNLHYLREIGNLGAHTTEDDQAQIVDVDRVEAEWTLDNIERLFDYFIETPARDAERRAAVDEKLKAAGRKAIQPLTDKTESAP